MKRRGYLLYIKVYANIWCGWACLIYHRMNPQVGTAVLWVSEVAGDRRATWTSFATAAMSLEMSWPLGAYPTTTTTYHTTRR